MTIHNKAQGLQLFLLLSASSRLEGRADGGRVLRASPTSDPGKVAMSRATQGLLTHLRCRRFAMHFGHHGTPLRRAKVTAVQRGREQWVRGPKVKGGSMPKGPGSRSQVLTTTPASKTLRSQWSGSQHLSRTFVGTVGTVGCILCGARA